MTNKAMRRGREKEDASVLADGVVAGDKSLLARVISKIEREDEDVPELFGQLYGRTGKALTVGFTGPPGVGKSSIIAKLIRLYREEDKKVSVVSVDPSSPLSKGAILGDRIRLSDHFLDEGVFIRSMGSRGHLGGLAATSRLAGMTMEAAGFDVVLYETVGVGQGEVEVASAADTVVLCLQPGAGDTVQALKAGVMEIADDVFCVNKADHPQARGAVAEIRSMLEIGHELASDAPMPEIVMTRGDSGEDARTLKKEIEAHQNRLVETGEMKRRKCASLKDFVISWATGRLQKDMEERLKREDQSLMQRVYERSVDPIAASEELFIQSDVESHGCHQKTTERECQP